MSNLAETPKPGVNGNHIVASNVRAEIGYADISQGDLAASLGLSDMALTRRLSDKYAAEFSASEIARIAELFGVEPGELFKVRERRTPRSGAGAGRRNIYLLDSVGLGSLDLPTSTVESGHLAEVVQLFPAA